MHEQPARAKGFVAEMGFFVGVDMTSVQNQFTSLYPCVGFAELAFSVSERFYLAAQKRNSTFDFRGDEIFVHRLSVGDAGAEVFVALFHAGDIVAEPDRLRKIL